MARRIRRKVARRRRGATYKVKRYGRRKKGLNGEVGLVVGSMLYGAGREWLSNKLSTVTRPVAGVAGDFADEVVLGSLGYFLAKGQVPLLKKLPFSREVGKAALVIESARVGSVVGEQFFKHQMVSNNTRNRTLSVTVA